MRTLAMLLVIATGWGGMASAGGEARDAVYRENPFSFFSRDYFARITHDKRATPGRQEMAIGADWFLVLDRQATPVSRVMAEDLAVFLRERMGLSLPLRVASAEEAQGPRTLWLSDAGGDEAIPPGAFTIRVSPDTVHVQGKDPAGLRDGVVRLVDRMGFRAAPMLAQGEETLTPRLDLRIGTVPRMGAYRDLVLLGYNGVIISPTDKSSATQLHALSQSRAIPELCPLQDPTLLELLATKAREARRHGLKTFVSLSMWDFYPKDAPLFANHPGLRGAEAYKHMNLPPPGHLLCTEDPLMRQYLAETLEGLFRALPLDGVLVIIGGEEFQHCFMRPSGVERLHTNCARCEALGAETVVANLCNGLADAARVANPEAVVVAWPYSAKYFWSADDEQIAFIEKLKPGTALLTEVEKDATISKEGGIQKAIWDYSIDLIGPTERAKRQIEACKKAGIKVYLKSEPELAFEAPGVPYIPCVDRWYDRAEALASCGADGAWVLAWFLPNHATTSAEVYKYAWWDPAPDREQALNLLARRIGGSDKAAAHLRKAWRHVSESMTWVPELPPYFQGPYYAGPTHPMCADPEMELPECFQGKSDFGAHILKEARGDVVTFGRLYRKMEQALGRAVEEMDAASGHVPGRCRTVFDGEMLPLRWLYHTARTHANFYESCHLRDSLLKTAKPKSEGSGEASPSFGRESFQRWMAILEDEIRNTRAARKVVRQDSRLDVHNTENGAALAPAETLFRAKLKLLQYERSVFLSSLAKKNGR